MCIRHISHWQPCNHQRCTGIDICEYAEAHPGLDPSDCPKGSNVFSEQAQGGECKICKERGHERRDNDRERRGMERHGHSRERRGHSTERHGERDESLDSVSTVDSDTTTKAEDSRSKQGEDGHDKKGNEAGDDQKKKPKKDGDDGYGWDNTIGLILQGVAHAAS